MVKLARRESRPAGLPDQVRIARSVFPIRAGEGRYRGPGPLGVEAGASGGRRCGTRCVSGRWFLSRRGEIASEHRRHCGLCGTAVGARAGVFCQPRPGCSPYGGEPADLPTVTAGCGVSDGVGGDGGGKPRDFGHRNPPTGGVDGCAGRSSAKVARSGVCVGRVNHARGHACQRTV